MRSILSSSLMATLHLLGLRGGVGAEAVDKDFQLFDAFALGLVCGFELFSPRVLGFQILVVVAGVE